jgi:hypothetical protein
MDTHYQDQNEADKPSPELIAARDVLASLEKMKADGADEDAVLEFLRRNVPTIQKARPKRQNTIQERMAQQQADRAALDQIEEGVRRVQENWNSAEVLPADIKEVGTRLIAQLDELRRQGEKQVKRGWMSEVEMLSQMWESAPDVSEAFGVQNSAPKRHPLPEEVPELAMIRQRIADETIAASTPIEIKMPEPSEKKESVQRAEPKTKPLAPTLNRDQITAHNIDGKLKRAVAPDAVQKQADHVVGSISEVRGQSKITVQELNDFTYRELHSVTPDEMLVQGWTDALRELTVVEWELEKAEGPGPVARAVWRWKGPHGEWAEVQIPNTRASRGEVNVRIWRNDHEKNHHQVMTADEIARLYLDPVPFLTLVLSQ